MERLGYLFVPEPASPDFHLLARPPERPRSHHLHVCEAGSAHEARHLAVRDCLRAHPDEAAAYAALKREGRHRKIASPTSPARTTTSSALEARAVAWAGWPRNPRPA